MSVPPASGDSTQVRLSRAALELFSERGFEATGIRDIGARAGVSTSGLYHYVRSKEDALHDLIYDGLSRHHDGLDAACSLVGRVEEKLVALVGVQVIAPVRHRAMSRLIQQEVPLRDWSRWPDVTGVVARMRRLWTAVLTAGREEGIFDFDAPKVVQIALLRSTTQVTSWYREDGAIELPDLVAQFADFALGGVRARRGNRYLRARHVLEPSFDDLSRVVDAAHEGVWW